MHTTGAVIHRTPVWRYLMIGLAVAGCFSKGRRPEATSPSGGSDIEQLRGAREFTVTICWYGASVGKPFDKAVLVSSSRAASLRSLEDTAFLSSAVISTQEYAGILDTAVEAGLPLKAELSPTRSQLEHRGYILAVETPSLSRIAWLGFDRSTLDIMERLSVVLDGPGRQAVGHIVKRISRPIRLLEQAAGATR
jgi:hypothetical protein